MNRQFYSLPEPGELGLKWKAFEEGREKIERVEGRRQEAAHAARDLEQRIREGSRAPTYASWHKASSRERTTRQHPQRRSRVSPASCANSAA